jgi:DNA polymerase
MNFVSNIIKQYLKQARELYGDEIYLEFISNLNTNNSNNHFKSNLRSFNNQINDCKYCSLESTSRNFVFGVGDSEVSLLLVSEIPIEKEDSECAFCGRAGKLLDKILSAIDRSREKDVCICNMLKSKLSNNSDNFKSNLISFNNQINLIKPKLIVALGRVAGMTLLNVDNSLKSMRGQIHNYNGTQLIVTYHPAALLRNPSWKPEVWKDFKWIRSIID